MSATSVFVVQNPTGQFEADCCDERCGFGMHLLVECDSEQEAERAATKHRGELRRMGEPERLRDREVDRLRAEVATAKAELERIRREIEAERDKTRDAEGATLRDENVIIGIVNGLGIALRIARGES